MKFFILCIYCKYKIYLIYKDILYIIIYSETIYNYHRYNRDENVITYSLPHADISCVMPSLFVDDLGSFFRILVVSHENVSTLDAHLTLVVRRVILHFRNIDEFDATASHRWSHMLRHVITLRFRRRSEIRSPEGDCNKRVLIYNGDYIRIC